MTRPDLVLALVQTAPVPGDVEANVARTVTAVAEAAASGARLVVLPELSLTGYDLTLLSDPACWVDGTADARLDPVKDAARRHEVRVVVGAAVRTGASGRGRIASLVLGPDGRHHVHPKVHLHGSETDLFTPGDPTPAFDVDGWQVALAVCFDVARPAHAAAAAQAGADVYVSSAVYVAGEERRLDLHHGARAMDHRIHVAVAGLTGPSSAGRAIGGSAVWRPDGVREATLGEDPGLLVHTLRAAERDRWRPARPGQVSA